MTQSGQGEEPSARSAREGIVLPSDGGEPVLPGMSAQPAGMPYQSYQDSAQQYGQTYGQDTAGAAPAGGQAWGGAWGPGQHPGAAQPPAADWPPAEPAWGAPEAAPAAPSWPQASGGAGPMPPENPQLQHAAYGAPLPPAAHEGATQFIPPVPPAPGGVEGATQFLPPVVAPAVDEGATQFIPPVGPGALPPEAAPAGMHPDAQATQYIAPVPADPSAGPYGGGLPGDGGDRQPPAEFDNLFRNDMGGDVPAGSTQQLPRIPQHDAGPAAYGGPGGYPAQASYAPPAGPGAGRRGARGDDGWGAGHPGEGGAGGGRSRSRVPLIAGIGIAIAVVGIGAGSLLGGGGDDKGEAGATASASASASAGSAPAAGGDGSKAQAVELDKLLAESGNSRAAVIAAVAGVRSCDNLGQAAADLRDAAKQRNELVTRLSGLSVDKLPDHERLTGALTEAWKASASADTHYAAWADQTAGNGKSCKKGQARRTGESRAGDAASGTASSQKKKAAQLWNTIARKYGLTERQSTQL
ncbi:hypothetical protein [Streptomyces adustus]